MHAEPPGDGVVRITERGATSAAWLVVSVVGLVLSVFALFVPPAAGLLGIGIAGTLLFGAVVFHLGRSLLDGRPVLEIGPSGFLYRSSGPLGELFVPWEETTAVRVGRWGLVHVEVRDPERILDGLGRFRRRWGGSKGGSMPFVFDASTLSVSREELMELLRTGMDRALLEEVRGEGMRLREGDGRGEGSGAA